MQGQIGQLLSRLFPTQRGLLHAYWAPNIWALYAAVDELLRIVGPKLFGLKVGPQSITKGLVQDTKFAVLPNVPTWFTMVLAVTLMAVS